jgi:copper homeostasis protein
MVKTMNQPVLLEVCANSVTSALAAQDGGSARVELCENLYEGGTTPSHGEILMARKLLHIKLHVLIRPRGGGTFYTDLEFDVMMADVKYCIDAGCDGIVMGMLKADGTVDKERCSQMVYMAKQHGLSVTFNRAFDMSADLEQSLEDIIELGCDRILTSGGRTTAMEGSSIIARLIKKAAGRIIIMPGCGISETNAADLVHFTGATEIHASARKRIESQMTFKNNHIVLGQNYGDEYSLDQTDKVRVKQIIKNANSQ